jgi:serine/threonine protein kinase
MASEQASGDPISARTDVWAYGLIAFYLLTGRFYWRGGAESISTIFAEVLHNPIVPPSQRAREFGLTPSWPEPFDAWFLRCVNRDPSARFATAGDAASALAESLLGDAWAATLPSGIRLDSIPPQSGPMSTTYPSAAQPGPSGPATTGTGAAASKTSTVEVSSKPKTGFIALGVVVLGALTFFSLRNNLERTVPDSRPHSSTASNGSAQLPESVDGTVKPVATDVRSLSSAEPKPAPPAASSGAPPDGAPPTPVAPLAPKQPEGGWKSVLKSNAPTKPTGDSEKGKGKPTAPISSSPIYTER